MKLIIMRGVSGSGKSTLAKKIAEQNPGSVVYSTDDFFMVDGQYQFDPKRLGEFHKKNHQRAHESMKNGLSCVIIDNTNTQAWEMKPYVESAIEFGYAVEICQPDPVDFDELMRRQSQCKNLSAEIVKRMLDRFEKEITVEKILESQKLFSN